MTIWIYPGEMSHGGIYTCVSYLVKNRGSKITHIDCSREGSFWNKIFHFASSLKSLVYECVCGKEQAAILHTALGRVVYRDWIYLFILRLFGKKTYIYLHCYNNPFEIRCFFVGFLTELIIRKCDGVITFSENLYGILNQTKRTLLVKNPSPIDQPRQYIKCRKQIIFAGSVSERKGCDLIYEAFNNKLLRDSEILLDIYTSQSESHLAQKLKTLPNVNINPYITPEQLREKVGEANILLLPSRAEGMPMVIIEALSVCTRVISCDVGSISMICNDKKLLSIVNHDPIQICHEIRRLVELEQPDYDNFVKWHQDFVPSRIYESINDFIAK